MEICKEVNEMTREELIALVESQKERIKKLEEEYNERNKIVLQILDEAQSIRIDMLANS